MTMVEHTSALWRHFTSAKQHRDNVTIVRGEGCYFWSSDGTRYLDGLAGLHSVNIGYGPWPAIADAAHRQLTTLPFFPNWFGFSNDIAEQLAERLRTISPVDVGQVFFVQSGSEAVESAMKLARQYHNIRGQGKRVKFISRLGAYHGTTMGALSINGSASFRAQFEPLLPGTIRVAPPYPYRCSWCARENGCQLNCADDIEAAIQAEGPETVAAVFIEPVQNSGGSLVPPPGYAERVREICDRYGVLLVLDETICGFGRVGEWFGSTRYGFRPDVLTVAKGLTSSYAPMGAMIVSAETSKHFFSADDRTFLHGSTFGGHPVSAAVAMANLDIIEQQRLLERVRNLGPALRERCDRLADGHPMIGEVRGDGYFVSLELVKDRDKRTQFTPSERAHLIGDILLPRVRQLGVQMKFDDRIGLAAQFTPPLVAGPDEFDVLTTVLGRVLDEAWQEASNF